MQAAALRRNKGLVPLPSQVLTSQPGDAISDMARFRDGPWASRGLCLCHAAKQTTEIENNS